MAETLKFKTTINCSGCIAAVAPALNQVAGEGKWKVDTDNPDKVLTVNTDTVAAADIIQAVTARGYQIQPL